jgi:hypothetical protein
MLTQRLVGHVKTFTVETRIGKMAIQMHLYILFIETLLRIMYKYKISTNVLQLSTFLRL